MRRLAFTAPAFAAVFALGASSAFAQAKITVGLDGTFAPHAMPVLGKPGDGRFVKRQST